ncbi:MAG TPA: T9SS type A sorting domain-containing protein [Bacteroidales bacterium]|nr:T9SS type A sorting domain-containing protein [Bacteroidales bacterium]HPS17413.1 T9SS type A sorting domain-containing protein [Bacteroidales bacterium]
MKKLLFVFVALMVYSGGNLIAQADCSGGRYLDSLFSVDVTNDIVYGHNYNYLGIYSTLKMDVYQPHGDVAEKRPLIIIAPGGSFIFEDKQDYTTVTLCEKFASLGYVTVGMDYRVGVSLPTQAQFRTALYRATHDMRAVVRYFKQDAATVNTYKVDTSIIIVGGSSAGAITALHVGYLDKISEILSQDIDTTGMGGVEGLSGNQGYSSKVNYIVNLCGALGDTIFLEPGDIPVISMHGTNDNTVPYASGSALSIVPVDGSATIKIRADHVGVQNPFYSFIGADHVPYDSGSNATSYILYMDTTFTFIRDNLYNWICSGYTDINENNLPASITVSPNPFTDYTEIYSSLPLQNASLEIFDITGKEVFQLNNINDNRIIIHRSGMPAGIYFYKLSGQNKKPVSSGKLAIQ